MPFAKKILNLSNVLLNYVSFSAETLAEKYLILAKFPQNRIFLFDNYCIGFRF